MSTISSDELSDVWGRVCRWPEPLRISLASRILQSLDHERRATSEKNVGRSRGVARDRSAATNR